MPVAPSSAYMLLPVGAKVPLYITPLAADTKLKTSPPCGSAVCQRILPVAASSAAQKPAVVVVFSPVAEVMVVLIPSELVTAA